MVNGRVEGGRPLDARAASSNAWAATAAAPPPEHAGAATALCLGLAFEASYNRGMCLVRLGRATEALRVLEPFADGLYGGCRQSEATQLVKALSRTTS